MIVRGFHLVKETKIGAIQLTSPKRDRKLETLEDDVCVHGASD